MIMKQGRNTIMKSDISKEAKEILALLAKHKNVLISGSPATGKSRVLNEVANAFVDSSDYVTIGQPIHLTSAAVPIPKTFGGEMSKVYPSPEKENRRVFRTTFHQNTKYREFITGIAPVINEEGKFQVMEGILYRASEFAKSPNATSLLIIDEINRGPAIEVFGGSIVAIEPDKRLDASNNETINTQKFEILNKNGDMEEYAFPTNLYILSAMNSADASIAPLDVAFLRRWYTYKLRPKADILYDVFKVTDKTIKKEPESPSDIYNVAISAWEKINKRIAVGRGEDYQIGHGVFLVLSSVPKDKLEDIFEDMVEIWPYLLTHIEECFWNDTAAMCSVLNISEENSTHPFKLKNVMFAGEERMKIQYSEVNVDNIYQLFLAIIGDIDD